LGHDFSCSSLIKCFDDGDEMMNTVVSGDILLYWGDTSRNFITAEIGNN
jgi:hypothetical protein